RCQVTVWDSSTFRLQTTIRLHNTVMSIAFSPDGKLLATASCDQAARLWDVATGRERVTLKGYKRNEVCAVAFSPDGKTFAEGGSLGTIKLWEIANLLAK